MHRLRLPRWVAALVIAFALLAAASTAASHSGRVDRRDQSIDACLRTTLDRAVNARGWRTAEHARRASAAKGGPTAGTDRKVARRYAQIAGSLESRTSSKAPGRLTFCRRAFPRPSLLPWKA